jgi:hypothetical protein
MQAALFYSCLVGGNSVLHSETKQPELSSIPAPTREKRGLEIPNAAPVRLQTLDFARHIVVAPDGKRYVVATYDETHLMRGIITAVFPQQNGYLTLVRLELCRFSSATPEEAFQHHVVLVQAIQQGKLRAYIQANQG